MCAVKIQSARRCAGMGVALGMFLCPLGQACWAGDPMAVGESLDFGDAVPLDDGRLDTTVGGAEIQTGDVGVNIAENSNTMLGNSVSGNVNTGQITGNTVQDVSGFNSMMYNTGNNVNFLNNTQVNVFLK